jgi:hypothetical protein
MPPKKHRTRRSDGKSMFNAEALRRGLIDENGQATAIDCHRACADRGECLDCATSSASPNGAAASHSTAPGDPSSQSSLQGSPAPDRQAAPTASPLTPSLAPRAPWEAASPYIPSPPPLPLDIIDVQSRLPQHEGSHTQPTSAFSNKFLGSATPGSWTAFPYPVDERQPAASVIS